MSEISATEPDLSREVPKVFWDPGRRLVMAIRRYQRASENGGFFGAFASKYWTVSYRFWSIVSGADIPLNAKLGGGLIIPHPNGIVINPTTTIGPNCMIFQQVTLGSVIGDSQAPTIGGHVDIGAGAKILGSITVGDHARIGANAVVTKDVAAREIVAGVPARVIGRVDPPND